MSALDNSRPLLTADVFDGRPLNSKISFTPLTVAYSPALCAMLHCTVIILKGNVKMQVDRRAFQNGSVAMYSEN